MKGMVTHRKRYYDPGGRGGNKKSVPEKKRGRERRLRKIAIRKWTLKTLPGRVNRSRRKGKKKRRSIVECQDERSTGSLMVERENLLAKGDFKSCWKGKKGTMANTRDEKGARNKHALKRRPVASNRSGCHGKGNDVLTNREKKGEASFAQEKERACERRILTLSKLEKEQPSNVGGGKEELAQHGRTSSTFNQVRCATVQQGKKKNLRIFCHRVP